MSTKNYLIGAMFATMIFTTVSAQDTTSTQVASPAQNGQPASQFIITKDAGLTDFIVVSCEGKTKEELYKKTIEWINKTYNKPSEVIKAQVENDYIRFQGISKDKYCVKAIVNMYYDIRYEVEISFKDGKYKFAVLSLEYATDLRGLRSWSKVNYKDSGIHFKKDGEVRTMFKDNITKIISYFNGLSKDLRDYVYNENAAAQQNDW